MRYYVVECGYSHNFRFERAEDAACFMASAAQSLIVESRNNRESLELVVVEEPEEIEAVEIEPEEIQEAAE